MKLSPVCNFIEELKIQDLIFLGDYNGDMSFPQKTMQLLYYVKKKYNSIFIKGNKEDYWINHFEKTFEEWTFGNSVTGMLKYNFENLTKKDLEFYKTLLKALKLNIKIYLSL